MKHLKRFESLNDFLSPDFDFFYGRGKNKEFTGDKIEEFITRFNKLTSEEHEQGYEPTNIDMLDIIGDMCNELDMNSEDIRKVIDSGRVNDFMNYLGITLDETIKSETPLKFNESSSSEYLLVVYSDPDEIHFNVLDYSFYDEIGKLVNNVVNKNYSEVDKLFSLITKNSISRLMCQSYCLEDFNEIGKYNIVKVINIPDMGL